MLLDLVPSIPIKTYLIDDGWQDIRHIDNGSTIPNGSKGGLWSFAAWDGMHASLKDVVDSIKAKGVEHVGVWLTLQGYWFCIHPDSPLIEKYGCLPHPSAIPAARGGADWPTRIDRDKPPQWLPSPEKADAFWLDWFSSLHAAGVDFVKVSGLSVSRSIR
jgi:hypothetical protein